MLTLLLAATVITGTAAYSNRIESAAEARGMDLAGLPGCAVLDCSRLGDRAWVRVDGAWTGPYLVVDCAAAHHRQFWRDKRRVVDLPRSAWDALGLPLRPYPVALSYSPPVRVRRLEPR